MPEGIGYGKSAGRKMVRRKIVRNLVQRRKRKREDMSPHEARRLGSRARLTELQKAQKIGALERRHRGLSSERFPIREKREMETLRLQLKNALRRGDTEFLARELTQREIARRKKRLKPFQRSKVERSILGR